jgi:hypothetical protein
MFFVASAVEDGRVNVSPKGLDSFRVLSPLKVAYLDITGSGNETAAHARAGGRATSRFCSYTRNPLVLRLYGRASVGAPGSALWREYADRFEILPGARQIVALEIDSVMTACGFGVPLMTLERPRSTLTDHWRTKTDEELADYRRRKTSVSIDGLPSWSEA